MRSLILKALFHPLNILMLGLSVVAGLVAAWWLFPLGIICWLIMVMAIWRDPSLRISHSMQNREPLAPRFQAYFDRIERSQVNVFNSLASAPSRTRGALEPVRTAIDRLVDNAHSLCSRVTVMENYRVVSQSRTNLKADLTRIDAKIAQANDPVVRQEYTSSRQSLVDRIAKLEAVSTQLERIEAQIVSTTNEMDSIVTEVIRLQALGPEDAGRRVPQLVKQIRQEADQLKDFERLVVDV